MIIVPRAELELFFDNLLNLKSFKDYGPNGLQVEGVEMVSRVAFAVSASLESIEAAICLKADTLIVHHGVLWDFHGVQPIKGAFGRRIRSLVRHGINLFGFHLPLDAHLEIGNAACIAQELGLLSIAPFGKHEGANTGVQGSFERPLAVSELRRRLELLLNHQVIVSSFDDSLVIKSIGIVTGGANGGWREAAASGLDAYLTGEICEHDWHEAKENRVHMFAGGHSATEVFGVRRLMQTTVASYGVDCFFIPSTNPV